MGDWAELLQPAAAVSVRSAKLPWAMFAAMAMIAVALAVLYFRAGTATVPETRLEVLLPLHRQAAVLGALRRAHPYEEVAYELVRLENTHQDVGAGLVGELPAPLAPAAFRALLKERLHVPVVRFTAFEKEIKTVALCGGAGAFLIGAARTAGADAYVTGDVKYHEFFGAEGRLMLCDVGHFESEQFTSEVFRDLLLAGFGRTFAVLFADTPTNPVHYDC